MVGLSTWQRHRLLAARERGTHLRRNKRSPSWCLGPKCGGVRCNRRPVVPTPHGQLVDALPSQRSTDARAAMIGTVQEARVHLWTCKGSRRAKKVARQGVCVLPDPWKA